MVGRDAGAGVPHFQRKAVAAPPRRQQHAAGLGVAQRIADEVLQGATQQPTIAQVLPLEASEEKELKHHWDYLYEPDAKELLDGLLTRYIESQVYQGVVENVACEQAARMVAMKAATDNAGEMLNVLRRTYNRTRQAAITQEIAEIVGGAAPPE